MIFTLEALEAKFGDSLILHWGTKKAPRFLLIDGGPSGVFKDALTKRLTQLREKFPQADGKLDLEMVMVSHIDDDHINGIVALFNDLETTKKKGQDLPYNIKTLWFNSFDEHLGNLGSELQSALASFNPAKEKSKNPTGISTAVLASVGQGRDLRASATRLAIPPNVPFKGLVMSPGAGSRAELRLPSKLTFTVVAPSRERLRKLGEEWEKDVKKNPDRGVLAAFKDRSVANLSSIVVLAKAGGKTMLLTGDARGDDILAGLDEAQLLKEGKLHVNLFKFPHHGSSHNMEQSFLEAVTADHYVISANGAFDNPDAETIEMLCKARGEDAYTVHITNEKLRNPKKKGAAGDVEAQIKKVFADFPSAKRKVVFRAPDALSVKVDLGADKVTY